MFPEIHIHIFLVCLSTEPPNLCPISAELGLGILCVRELLREKERRFKTHLSGEKNLEYFVGRVLAGLAMWPELRVGSRGRGPQPQLPVTGLGLSPEPGSGPQTPASASRQPQKPSSCLVTQVTGGP